MALLILALLQRIFLMSSLMLLLVWLIFFMVLIKLLPILGTISGKTRSEERFSRNAETDIVCRLLLAKKKTTRRWRPQCHGRHGHPRSRRHRTLRATYSATG